MPLTNSNMSESHGFRKPHRPVPGQSRHFDISPRTSALSRSADIADRVRQVVTAVSAAYAGGSISYLCNFGRDLISSLRLHEEPPNKSMVRAGRHFGFGSTVDFKP